MWVDCISQFKIFLTDHLVSLKMRVNPEAVKISNHSRNDVLIHIGNSTCNEDLMERLSLKCQSLKLKIDLVTFENNHLIVKLNRLATFKQCFTDLSGLEILLPIASDHQHERLDLMYDADCSLNDLTNFRIHLFLFSVKNLASAIGYDVRINENNVSGLYFSYKSNLPKDAVLDHKLVLCGPVLNAGKSGKEKDITTENCKRLKKISLLREMENRDNFNDELSDILVDTIVKFEFLRVKASSPVILNFNELGSSSTGSAVFVLYNYSRLNAIIHEFENRVLREYYPPLPSVENMDFSVLKEEKEWMLIFKYVMNFPMILKESMQFMREGKPSPHLLCSFLFAFARTISSYYRSTKILLEAKPNLLPLVYARVYLIKIVQRVLLTGLELLNVKAVPVL